MSTTLDALQTHLSDALRAAKMESMSLGFPNDLIEVKSVHSGSDRTGRVGDLFHPTDYVRTVTELYRHSWIIGPLERAFELVEQNRELIRQCEALREALNNTQLAPLIELARAGMD